MTYQIIQPCLVFLSKFHANLKSLMTISIQVWQDIFETLKSVLTRYVSVFGNTQLLLDTVNVGKA